MHARRRTGLRRLMHRLDTALTVAIVGAFVVFAAAVVSGSLQVRPVLSGSMRPDIPVGGVVVTQRVPVSEVRVGDVIVFYEPDGSQELVVHRVASLTPASSGPVLQTKGDANGAPDPWTISLRGEHAYRAVSVVPLVGYVAVWAHNPSGGRILVAAGVALVAVAAVGTLVYLRRSAGRSRRASRHDAALSYG